MVHCGEEASFPEMEAFRLCHESVAAFPLDSISATSNSLLKASFFCCIMTVLSPHSRCLVTFDVTMAPALSPLIAVNDNFTAMFC